MPSLRLLVVSLLLSSVVSAGTARAEAPPHLAGLAFQVEDLDRCAAYLTKQRIPHRTEGRGLLVRTQRDKEF